MCLTTDSQTVPEAPDTCTEEVTGSQEGWDTFGSLAWGGAGYLSGKMLSRACQGGGQEVSWVHGMFASLHDVTSFEYHLHVQVEDSGARAVPA